MIELLVVLALVAILSVVVVMTLNPAELLKQARDSNRFSDISTINTALNLAAGASQVLCVSADAIQMPSQSGAYTVWVEVFPVWPSQLSDTNPLNNIAVVLGTITVDPVSVAGYWGFNDFDGDGISDLVMDVDGFWYARTVDNS